MPKMRPTDDVRNLFAKKTHGMQKSDMNSVSMDRQKHLEAAKKQRKKIFEFEGRYDDIPDDNPLLLL